MNDTDPFGFGLAPIKMEGGIANPDEFAWECDLNKCEQCRTKYLNWKQKYMEEQDMLRNRSKE